MEARKNFLRASVIFANAPKAPYVGADPCVLSNRASDAKDFRKIARSDRGAENA